MNPTPRQVEFREKLSRLIVEHTDIIGPPFDGSLDDEDRVDMEMPANLGWVLVAEWADAATADTAPVVIIGHSGLRWVERLGLLTAAIDMEQA